MIDIVICFFLLGLVAGSLRSNLRLPSAAYDIISMLLLLAIGLKGGAELAQQSLSVMLPQIALVALMGIITPFVLYPILITLGKFKKPDAASIAAHYGSVSIGTFAVALAYFEARGIPYESHLSLFVVVLEIPAIIVGIFLAKGHSSTTSWKKVAHEVFLGKSIILLLGGLIIAWVVGPEQLESIKPFFIDPFKGVLALFLLEMGLVVASKLGSLKNYGLFLVAFGIFTPIIFSFLGIVVGYILNLSPGGMAIMGTLAASSSYIAVPAAMRVSVPESNPTLSLTASLGITFPFNVIVGIPMYYMFSLKFIEIIGAD